MPSTWLLVLLGITALVVGVPYVLGPILIFASLRFRMPPTVLTIDPRQEPLPASAREYFDRAYAALTADGFQYVATIGLPDMVPNVRTIFAVYTQRESGDLAMSAIIVGDGGMMSELKTSYVEFVRRYDDDIVVQTNNSRQLSSFKSLPGEHTAKFWDVSDLRRLYQLHCKLAEKFRQRGRPVNALLSRHGGDAAEFVAQTVLHDTFQKQIATGYLAACPEGFRPTPIGAWIMTWKELFPFKQLRMRSEKSKADRLLAELG